MTYPGGGGGYDANADTRLTNPIMGNGIDTQHMAGILVVSAIGFLFLVRRGFRGLSVGGVSVGIR